MLSDLPDADALVVPTGSGGLIAGITTAAGALRPNIKIIGVQAEGAAGCRASLDAGELRPLPSIATIADGIAVKRPGSMTFPIIQRLVDDVVVVNDEAIIGAVLLLMERNKMLVEGAGAAGGAAPLTGAGNLQGMKIILPFTLHNNTIYLISPLFRHR